ncbi:MAG: hypothetical protein JOY60_16000 [Burkholderiaceae bacterium]|nr:hypothetical protein [Roseateles sp.]MBV8471355.1 hypothetical protein [Burkholderiaceae bacterium]
MIRSYDKAVPTLTEVLDEPQWSQDVEGVRDDGPGVPAASPVSPEPAPLQNVLDALEDDDAGPPAWDRAAQEDFQLILNEPVHELDADPDVGPDAEADAEPAVALDIAPELEPVIDAVSEPAMEPVTEPDTAADHVAGMPSELPLPFVPNVGEAAGGIQQLSAAIAARLEAQLEQSLTQFLHEQLPMALDDVMARMMPTIAQSMSDVLRPKMQAHVRVCLLHFDQAE